MSIDASAVARVVGIDTKFEDRRAGNILFLPQRIAVVGQGSSAITYSLTKQQVTSASQAASIYGFGSPIHLSCLQLFPVNGDGVGTIPVTIYPMADAMGAVAATGDITPSGAVTSAGQFTVRVNEIESEPFVVSIGDSVAAIVTAVTQAINATLEMPVIAADNTTAVGLTAKWAGVSSNQIFVEVVGPTTTGVIFTITQLSGGLVNPDVSVPLAQVGNVWESIFLNCLDLEDTTALDAFSTFGEGRWGQLVRKPAVALTGTTLTTVTAATAISDARPTDRVNGQIPAPASNELPFVVAARAISRIAPRANNNPPYDYGSLPLSGLVPGPDGDQWTYADRDSAIKKGSSATEVRDGVITLSDTVTFYHPASEPIPAYRYVVDIVKLQTIIFNLDLIFATPEWDGAPLIPDGQPTVNPAAKKPSSAKTAVATMIDSLAANAIISNPEDAKANMTAEIDSMNPKRLNVCIPIQLSGNSNIISVDLKFGFFFGTQAIVA